MRTPQRSSRADPTTGRTGASCGGGTVCICGQMPPLWSCPTGATAGSASSWTASWPPCTPVGVRREARTAQRTGGSSWRSYSGRGVRLSKAQSATQSCPTSAPRDWWWVTGHWRVRRRESSTSITRTDSKSVMYV